MPNQFTWAAVAFALIPVLSTLAAVWLTHHFQFKTKKLELDSQTKLKARELYFSLYQQRLERLRLADSNAEDIIGKTIAAILVTQTPEEKEAAIQEMLTAFKLLDNRDRSNRQIKEFEIELKEAGLFDKYKQDFIYLREHFAVDPTKLTTQEFEQLIYKMPIAKTIESKMVAALITKKCDELFSEYLPK